jgi:hypothetical protein
MLTLFFRLLGSLKIFLPIATLALLVLIPVNVSGGTLLDLKKEVVFSDIDKLSISNVNPGSNRYGSYELFFFFWLFLYTHTMSRIFSMSVTFSVLFLHVAATQSYLTIVIAIHFRFFIHLLMAYVFTFWACFMLYKEYSNVAFMRLHFLASQKRCADHFTVSTLAKYDVIY